LTEVGVFLSSEEHGPADLATYAREGERARFGSSVPHSYCW